MKKIYVLEYEIKDYETEDVLSTSGQTVVEDPYTPYY